MCNMVYGFRPTYTRHVKPICIYIYIYIFLRAFSPTRLTYYTVAGAVRVLQRPRTVAYRYNVMLTVRAKLRVSTAVNKIILL